MNSLIPIPVEHVTPLPRAKNCKHPHGSQFKVKAHRKSNYPAGWYCLECGRHLTKTYALLADDLLLMFRRAYAAMVKGERYTSS